MTLRLDELVELWRALGDPERCKADPVTIATLRLLILTGQRECEVTGASWNEFDLDGGVWRIPATRTKVGRAHLVHLAPQAVAILKGLQPLTTGNKNYVFASPLRKGQPIRAQREQRAAEHVQAGVLPKVTPCHVHDLRRTLVSRLPDLGVESLIGHKIANHRLPGVLAIYNHAEYWAEREAALKRWAEHIHPSGTADNVIQASFKQAA